MSYFIVTIDKTARHRNEKEYSSYTEEEKKFRTMEEVKEFLTDKYRGKHREPIYRDTRKGLTEQVGYTYGFKFDSSTYGETSGFERHWVTVKQVEPKSILIRV